MEREAVDAAKSFLPEVSVSFDVVERSTGPCLAYLAWVNGLVGFLLLNVDVVKVIFIVLAGGV